MSSDTVTYLALLGAVFALLAHNAWEDSRVLSVLLASAAATCLFPLVAYFLLLVFA